MAKQKEVAPEKFFISGHSMGAWLAPRIAAADPRVHGADGRGELFEGWKKALEAKKSATLKLYPGLNHHFMPGSGKSTPAEYQTLNHVPAAVLDELAAWLKSN